DPGLVEADADVAGKGLDALDVRAPGIDVLRSEVFHEPERESPRWFGDEHRGDVDHRLAFQAPADDIETAQQGGQRGCLTRALDALLALRGNVVLHGLEVHP